MCSSSLADLVGMWWRWRRHRLHGSIASQPTCFTLLLDLSFLFMNTIHFLAGPAAAWGVKAAAAEVSPSQLTDLLTFPHTWGPTEWGPIPYLPSEDVLVKRMEKQWGRLASYRGINSTMRGNLLVPGVQLGNVWIGVQPLLGLEGDPMRLLFERDLTPHPQYAAAYKWLQEVR